MGAMPNLLIALHLAACLRCILLSCKHISVGWVVKSHINYEWKKCWIYKKGYLLI
jgi:hypothetical protein